MEGVGPAVQTLGTVFVSKRLQRFAVELDGALPPDAVGGILVGTSDCYNPPGRAAMNYGVLAGPEACW